MKRFPFKRHLVILGACILLIGVMVPLATFAKSASGEPRNPSHPPQVKMKTNQATGTSDPTVTIMQGCPATAPINPTPFSAGDVITGTATFTSTDPNEGTETEEANNTLSVLITIPGVSVKLNQTTPFTFTARAGDNLFACFAIYDGDEVGTINYTVTSIPPVPTPVPTPPPPSGKPLGPFPILKALPIVLNGIDCGVGFIPATSGLGKSVIVRFIKNVGTARGVDAVVKDLATGTFLRVPLDLALLAPFASCITGIAEIFAPGQLDALTECLANSTPEERQCLQNIINRVDELLPPFIIFT